MQTNTQINPVNGQSEIEPDFNQELFFWLENGINYVGASHQNDFQLPATAAKFVCILIVETERVLLRVAEGQVISYHGRPVDNFIVSTPKFALTLQYQQWLMRVIREGNRYAVSFSPMLVTK